LVIQAPGLKRIPIDILLEIKEKIQEMYVPIVVDLIDCASFHDSFHFNIETDHDVLLRPAKNYSIV